MFLTILDWRQLLKFGTNKKGHPIVFKHARF